MVRAYDMYSADGQCQCTYCGNYCPMHKMGLCGTHASQYLFCPDCLIRPKWLEGLTMCLHCAHDHDLQEAAKTAAKVISDKENNNNDRDQ